MNTIISLDCESNGLHGVIFAAAAAVYVDGVEVATWQERSPIYREVDPWVAARVLPAIKDMSETVNYYDEILASWRDFYAEHADALVIAHVPWPVEARFLWDAHHAIPFSGPFPLIDVASVLLAYHFDPTSVDCYLTSAGIKLPEGSPHHPLYDCRAAALAYFDLTGHN